MGKSTCEWQMNGKVAWLTGTVKAKHRDKTFKVQLDDGTHLKHVSKHHMRAPRSRDQALPQSRSLSPPPPPAPPHTTLTKTTNNAFTKPSELSSDLHHLHPHREEFYDLDTPLKDWLGVVGMEAYEPLLRVVGAESIRPLVLMDQAQVQNLVEVSVRSEKHDVFACSPNHLFNQSTP